jgi:Zn-dependent peptidase ImmA (M78 family)
VPREFVSSQDLERVAKQFLQQHHPSLELPIPIEEIAEFGLDLDIVPIPGLYRDYKIESWLSCDQQAIYIDQRQCEEMETRYRFSLAHEIGHLLLHSDLYKEVSLGSFEDWISFHEGLDAALRDSLEWQARSLAGRILVPAGPLLLQAQQRIDSVKTKLPKGVDPEALFGAVAIPLSDVFNVHEEVVRIRLSGDGIGHGLWLK